MNQRKFKSKKGTMLLDAIVVLLVVMLLIMFCMQVLTVFLQKQQIQAYTKELVREIEIAGRIDESTIIFQQQLNDRFHFEPEVSYSKKGLLQLGQTFLVTVKFQGELGLFSSLGSVPVTLTTTAEGKSEVYHK